MNSIIKLKSDSFNITDNADFRKPNTNTTDIEHNRRIERENIPIKTPDIVIHEVGIFWTTKPITKRQLNRLTELIPFYHTARIKNILIPIISMRCVISLRALDWFIINYSKKHKITLTNYYSHLLSVYDDYRVWLKYWRRSTFDAFRRGPRLYFSVGDISYCTTVAQLNFLYWSEKTGVLGYVAKYIHVIEKDMNERIAMCKKQKQLSIANGNKRKRSELSKSSMTHCMVYKIPITIQF